MHLENIKRMEVNLMCAKMYTFPSKSDNLGVSPESQIRRILQLNSIMEWGLTKSDFPKKIPEFVRRTPSEILMLSVNLPKKNGVSGVQRTFDELWNAIQAPDGYTKWRWENLKSDSAHLKQLRGTKRPPGVRCVIFDPLANQGEPYELLWANLIDNFYLANSEVLMAAILFPDWVKSWGIKGTPYPRMAGYQFFRNNDCEPEPPSLSLWDDDHKLKLGVYWTNDNSYYAMPTIREC
jgi:hypothetical protein